MLAQQHPARCKLFSIGYNDLLTIIQGKSEIAGLPEDAKIVGIQSNFCSMCFDIIIHSETFEETPIGQQFPNIRNSNFPYKICVLKVPKEQFDGCSYYTIKEGTELIIAQEAIDKMIESGENKKIKFREFI